MAGRTLEEARAAQHAASGRPAQAGQSQQNNPTNSSAHVATANQSSSAHAPITINGISYMPMPLPTAPTPLAPPSTASSDNALSVVNAHTSPGYDFSAYATANGSYPPLPSNYDFHTFVAITGPMRASVDWDDYSKPVDLKQITAHPVAFTASHVPVDSLTDAPFFLDTGATCHISPIRSDFKTLQPISPHPISGVGGACVYAAGLGTVELCVAAGHKIVMENVLYVPASTVRLISVLTLNRSGRYTSHFDSFFC
jgi:hypothetical protein